MGGFRGGLSWCSGRVPLRGDRWRCPDHEGWHLLNAVLRLCLGGVVVPVTSASLDHGSLLPSPVVPVASPILDNGSLLPSSIGNPEGAFTPIS